MSWQPPSISDFKGYFTRDFPYAPLTANANYDYVLDGDITKALEQAEINFNESLGMSGREATVAFLFLTAFYLIIDLQLAQRGIASQANFSMSSKGVGSVSVTFQIPERYSKDPQMTYYAQNGYGQKYLSLVFPYMTGNVRVVEGTTTFD